MAGPETLVGGVGQGLDRRRVGHVGDDAQDLAPLTQLGGRGRDQIGLHVGDDERHALGQQLLTEGPADPPGATGHDGHPANQLVHVSPISELL